MQEGQNVSLVLALLSLPDVVHDHVADFFHAVLLVREILSEGGGGDLRQILMLTIARTCASVKPDNATQSSKLIIKLHC
jgi:hypothetical protein